MWAYLCLDTTAICGALGTRAVWRSGSNELCPLNGWVANEQRRNARPHATPQERDSSAGDTSFEILQFNNVEDGAADESFGHAILVAVHADVYGASLNNGHVVVGHIKV